MLDENTSSGCPDKNGVASFSSLASVMALGHFFQCTNSDILIEKRLPELLFSLLASMAAWLHANAPIAVGTSKYGFVPNKEAYKINPHHEAYTVLVQVMNVVNPNATENMVNGPVSNRIASSPEAPKTYQNFYPTDIPVGVQGGREPDVHRLFSRSMHH